MMTSIFLSHSSKDNEFTKRLADELSDYGIIVWIAEAELKIGDSLLSKLSSAITKSDYVGAILSKNSVQSNWVLKELKIAMSQEVEGQKLKVLPILIECCNIPEFLIDKLYADFTDPNDYQSALLRLLHTLGISNPKIAKKNPIEELKETIMSIMNSDDYKPISAHGLISKIKPKINCSLMDIRHILKLLENEKLVEYELSGKFLVYKARTRKNEDIDK